MKNKLKIKQFMPIPENYTVLSPCSDCDGRTFLWNPESEGWTYSLILVDGGDDEDDYITFYSIDDSGSGDVDREAKMVRREYCDLCKREMKPHLLEDGPDGVLWYECCGNKKKFIQEEK